MFGKDLASAEKSVSEAVAQVPQEVKVRALTKDEIEAALHQRTSTRENLDDVDSRMLGFVQHAEVASANPSFIIIEAWEVRSVQQYCQRR
jgi:hypothetical protein